MKSTMYSCANQDKNIDLLGAFSSYRRSCDRGADWAWWCALNSLAGIEDACSGGCPAAQAADKCSSFVCSSSFCSTSANDSCVDKPSFIVSLGGVLWTMRPCASKRSDFDDDGRWCSASIPAKTRKSWKTLVLLTAKTSIIDKIFAI